MESLDTYNDYAQVILPLALPKLYTYAVPKRLEKEVEIGMRVEVQLGKRKQYSGIVYALSKIPPQEYTPKEIISVIDEKPIVTGQQIQLWKWMSEYYLCTMGEVMNAAMPAYLKLDSETFFRKNPHSEMRPEELSDDEFLICEALENQEEISLEDIQTILQKKSVAKIINSMLQKQLLLLKEVMYEKYTLKTEVTVELTAYYAADFERLSEAFDLLKRSPKQEQLLLAFIELSKSSETVTKLTLLKRSGTTASVLNGLVEKNIFQYRQQTVDRVQINDDEKKTYELSKEQGEVSNNIQDLFQSKNTVLLHGITSSGKTLVYIDLIKKLAAEKKQVLFLLPEIALTAQLISRLQKWLGNIAVYHSKLNNAERVEIWNKVLQKKIQIIVGARSALFLPFQNIGLIIVDEEHDPSYKQHDPAPRYQGRDTAIYLGNIFDAKVLLGSATPSIETYSQAKAGKYGLTMLNTRYGDMAIPEIQFVNVREAKKKKEYVSGLTFILRDAIQEALDKQQQIILFQNRRGYAPYLECNKCAWVPMCKNCDVTLTYHKYTNDLRCHYCGYTQSLVHQCKKCGSHEIEQKGLGTERIEDDLQTLFPEAKVGRMDYDTVRTKHGHEKIIEQFENGEFDILVGTQMVTKGLDFDRVALVGVINADALLNFPDFRAFERAYQLLVQVSGRAGRKDHKGKVLIQISDLEHPVVTDILEGNYLDFYKQQLAERKEFDYPPFSRMIQLTLKDKDFKVVEKAGILLSKELQKLFGDWVIGPNKPLLQKINNWYIREVLLKIPRESKNLAAIKNKLKETTDSIYQYSDFKQTRVIMDVDPY